MTYNILPEEPCTHMEEAVVIMQTLLSYGNIHTVQGVVYPEGSHKEMIDKANLWLWNYRQSKLAERPYPNIDLAENLVEDRIKELQQTFIQCFSPPSDTDCVLTEKLYETICEYHNLESNGLSEEHGVTLVYNLLEFFNRQKQLPSYRFKEFLEDYVEGYI